MQVSNLTTHTAAQLSSYDIAICNERSDAASQAVEGDNCDGLVM